MQADFLTGVPLLKREDESLYEYWVSFSPMAPLFGVPWRFAPSLIAATGAKGDATDTPLPTPAAKAIELVSTRPAPAFETRPTPKATDDAPAEKGHAADPKAASDPGPAAPEVADTVEDATASEGDVEAPTETAPALRYDPAPARTDDLKLIKGVGPKLEAELNALGLYTFEQMAKLTPENLNWIDARLSATTFKGRGLRDDWPGQAAALLEA